MSMYEWSVNTDESRLRRLERGSTYLRRGSAINGSSKLVRSISADIVSADGTQIDLTAGGVRTAGSIPPSGNNTDFVVVATDITATIHFDGTNGSKVIGIYRADGSVTRVPAGSITVNGLVASTTYNVLPYWSPNNLCTIGWVQGTVGTPQICIVGTPTQLQLQQQSLAGREPLSNGTLTFKTTAGGTSTGGIGSGGDSTRPPTGCVMLGTDIDPLDGMDYETKNLPCTHWWHIVTQLGKSLFCTPDHPLYTWNGERIEAKDCRVGARLTTIDGDELVAVSEPHTRVCTKVMVTMPKLHLFWANGILSHNVKTA